MVRSGEMRHQVRIEVRSASQDAAGEQVVSWLEFATQRAAVERSPGSEVWSSAQRSGRVPTVFRLRFVANVTPAMRIVWNGRVYNLLSVVDQKGLGEELLITAEEQVGESP